MARQDAATQSSLIMRANDVRTTSPPDSGSCTYSCLAGAQAPCACLVSIIVDELHKLMRLRCRRRYYTTPKSYLDLINLYLQLLQEKR